MTAEKKILGKIIITALLKAQRSLNLVLQEKKTDVIRDATIQRFEYTFELAWKTMKRILKHKGLEAANPRDVFRLAAQDGLISDPTLWFDFLEKRNLTSHTYNEETADKVFAVIPRFSTELQTFVKKIEEL